MYISAVSSNQKYNAYSSNMKRTNNTSFNGSEKRALDIIKPKISSIKTCSSFIEIKPIIENLTRKWNMINPYSLSFGILTIPEKDLANILEEKKSNFDLKNIRGICVAIGDHYGPIENWHNCKEAILVLIPKRK